MASIKNEEEIERIRKSALLVSATIAHLAKNIKIGISTLELDRLAEDFIYSHAGASPSFKGYRGYPYSICASLNHAVVHGFPSADAVLKEGDVLSIDVGVYMNDFHGDSAFTFFIHEGEEKEEDRPIVDLLRATKASLYKGIDFATASYRVGDIGYAIQQYCEARNFGVVRDLTGHGIGRNLHEEPNVPNYGKPSNGTRLKSGMVIAIEPMITLGTHKVFVEKDGWTIVTKDKKIAAHYEHTVAVGEKHPFILSDFSLTEKAVEENPFLFNI